MSRWNDPHYLREKQYRDPGNLNARAALHRRFSTNDYPWQRWVFDRLDLPAEARVLELGCGPGDLWADNRDRLPAGWRLTLTDLSAGMVGQIRRRLGLAEHAFVYARVDAQALPFPCRGFNAVIANHVLYHAPCAMDVLHEAHRVLVPGGRLYAATNGLRHMRELTELVSRFLPRQETENVVASFSLETGGAQLQEVFSSVRTMRQDNGLVVIDPQAVVTYVRSYVSGEKSKPGLAALGQWVHRHMADHGALAISKDAGMFIATK